MIGVVDLMACGGLLACLIYLFPFWFARLQINKFTLDVQYEISFHFEAFPWNPEQDYLLVGIKSLRDSLMIYHEDTLIMHSGIIILPGVPFQIYVYFRLWCNTYGVTMIH